MRRTLQMAAPLLSAAALELLAGCNTSKCISNDTHQAVDISFCRGAAGVPVTIHAYHLETQRGGFGHNLAPIIMGSTLAAIILFGSGS